MPDLKRNATILLLALVGTAGIAGCGGGGGDDEAPAPAPVEEPETTTLTKNELISQGDNYCAEVNAAVGTISSSTADDSIKQTQISSIYDGLANDLESLGSPSEGEAPTAVIEAAQALAESDSATADAALATFQSAAEEYGFTKCGEAPAAPSSGTSEAPSTTPDTGSGYAEPAPAPVEPAPAPAPAPAPPPSNGGGGGVAPPSDPGTGGGSSGGSSSGGISPG